MKTRSHMLIAVLTVFLLAPNAMALKKKQLPGSGEVPILVNIPPLVAPHIKFTERTANTISLEWVDINEEEDGYQLLRQNLDTGQWSYVSSWGEGNGTISYDDTALNADTRYCYSVRVFNQKDGEFLSSPRCAYTRDGNAYEVWRAQLLVMTADVKDANTKERKNGVHIRLNEVFQYNIPSGNGTWLDYGRNDFEKGDTFTYDLNLNDVDELGDITQIGIYHEGDDGWCIERLALVVNGLEVYNISFGSTPSTCQWLDTEAGKSSSYVISHDDLRAHPKWSSYNEDAARLLLLVNQGIPQAELESRIEAKVGDNIHGTKAYWGHLHGPAVEAKKGCPLEEQSCSTVHLDLDLAADINNWWDPAVDVDFDLMISCMGGELSIEAMNVDIDVDSKWYSELLSLGIINVIDGIAEDRVREIWPPIMESFNFQNCPSFNVENDGSIRIVEQATSPQVSIPSPGNQVVKPDDSGGFQLPTRVVPSIKAQQLPR